MFKINRYPGPEAFTTEKSHIFFGREEDTHKLFTQLTLKKQIVLHGRSGIGKSSLVAAGLIPLLNTIGHTLCMSVRFNRYNADIAPPVIQLFNTINDQSADFDIPVVLEKVNHFKNTLWYAAKKLQLKYERSPSDADKKNLNPNIDALKKEQRFLFSFDQFEEIFSFPVNQVNDFKLAFSELLLSPIPHNIKKYIYSCIKEKEDYFTEDELEFLFKTPDFRALFIIRSDSLSMMDTLSDCLPELLTSLYELKPLSREQCREAIIKPASLPETDTQMFESPPFTYTTEALEHILNSLEGNVDSEIATNLLQWVLRRCEYKIQEKKQNKSIDKLIICKEDIGDVEQIIKEDLNKILDELGSDKSEIEKLLQEHFIKGGNRVLVPDKIIGEDIIEKEGFRHLIREHIISAEDNKFKGKSYELCHDTLVKPILEEFERRKEAEEKAALEIIRQKELQKLEEEKLALEQKRQEEQRRAEEKAERDRLELENKEKELQLEKEKRERQEQLILLQKKAAKKQKKWLLILSLITLIAVYASIQAFLAVNTSDRLKKDLFNKFKEEGLKLYNNFEYKDAKYNFLIAGNINERENTFQIDSYIDSCDIQLEKKQAFDSLINIADSLLNKKEWLSALDNFYKADSLDYKRDDFYDKKKKEIIEKIKSHIVGVSPDVDLILKQQLDSIYKFY